MKQKVFLDPSAPIQYASFYILGLYEQFGKRNVTFSSQPFRELYQARQNESEIKKKKYFHYLPFVVISNGKEERFVIDFKDSATVKAHAYDWCDTYAKININLDLTEEKYWDKMVCIPPNYSIRIWGKLETLKMCLKNLVLQQFNPVVTIKKFLNSYRLLAIHPTHSDYTEKSDQNANAKKPYVFHIATLWSHANCKSGTNILRREFIESCIANDKCHFEGGFYVSPTQPPYEGYHHLTFQKKYSNEEYVKKSKSSSLIFNTPSVYNCHGWKLGETLAMGKAIISSPLINVLPVDLVHGKNIHFVKDRPQIKGEVDLLLKDHAYRKKLEAGAKAYYDQHMAPAVVVKSIMDKTYPITAKAKSAYMNKL